MKNEQELAVLDLNSVGPEIEHHELFPNRTNVSWYAEVQPGRIRARIFERGVGETTASGTDATGAAVAYVLQGGHSPVAVVHDGGEMSVEVRVVFRGSLTNEFVEEVHARE